MNEILRVPYFTYINEGVNRGGRELRLLANDRFRTSIDARKGSQILKRRF